MMELMIVLTVAMIFEHAKIDILLADKRKCFMRPLFECTLQLRILRKPLVYILFSYCYVYYFLGFTI